LEGIKTIHRTSYLKKVANAAAKARLINRESRAMSTHAVGKMVEDMG
jgi:hypothetical protein